MNLKSFLARDTASKKSKHTDWLPFCTLKVTSGSLWAGDPKMAHHGEGCVVKVPKGEYQVEAIGLTDDGGRSVARLRVRLVSATYPELGKSIATAGTDSAKIGVCDRKAFAAACKAYDDSEGLELFDEIDSLTDDRFGIASLNDRDDAWLVYVPTGSDGTGPVYELLANGKRVGIELPFEFEDCQPEPKPTKKLVSYADFNRPEFMTYLNQAGQEVTFWAVGDFKAGKQVKLWSSAKKGPVKFRIINAKGSTVRDWTRMPKAKKYVPHYPFQSHVMLKQGIFTIEFQVGKELFPPLTVTII